MKKLKFKHVFCIILSILLLGVLMDCLRTGKYKVGMTYDEARQLMPQAYKKDWFGIDYDLKPTPQQLMEDAIYTIYEEDEGVVLDFNHHDKIIKIERVKYLGVDLVKLKMLFN